MASPEEVSEVERLRARVVELEREKFELAERTNRVVAETQERVYWLDRWHLDLNAIMRKRWTSDLRAALRMARLIFRQLLKGVRTLQHRLAERRGVL